MNAVERVVEYSRIPIERQYVQNDGGGNRDQATSTIGAAWPPEGRIEVVDLFAGYAPDLPPALKGLTFTVEKNQRIGIVGRTGAGKSTLSLALFRLVEARKGNICIDGVDISRISLYDLRSRLAIIPQDPVLFSGTVRSNLDTFDSHTDAELYDALESVHLRYTGSTSPGSLPLPIPGHKHQTHNTNFNLFQSLSSRISEGGLNLSQGQRQLLCLARAIVSRPKIMVLDEATSSVDMATDALIQRSIRTEFGNSTLLVIAHRLSTVADFDKILVMSDGQGVEFDTPRALMEKRGVFWGMVQESGEKGRLEEIIFGEKTSVDVGEGSSRVRR